MEMIGVGYLIGILTTMVFVGIGVVIARRDRGTDKGQSDNDSDVRVYVPSRDRGRRRDKCADISDEGLAAILRSMVATGYESDYLIEAAKRLEKPKWIYKMDNGLLCASNDDGKTWTVMFNETDS